MVIIYEFHISRRARQRYQIDSELLGTNGRLIVSASSARPAAGMDSARRIASRVFAVTGRAIAASDIFAAALIEEILHIVVREYLKQDPGLLADAVGFLQSALGPALENTLLRFTEEFPPASVYRGEQSPADYLAGSSMGMPHRQVSLEEMLLLNVANSSPALEPYREFFDDSVLKDTAYSESILRLREYFSQRPSRAGSGSSPLAGSLMDLLEAPSRAAPYSIEGQLQYLLDRWASILSPAIRQLVMRAMDFVREEVLRHTAHGAANLSPSVPDFRGEPEYERYSTDLDWMPRLVLIARNSYVWLEQLSRKHQRWIRTLDQVPDEELDLLASRGFTGLWLIGLWERSRASQRIKQRMGQPDAAASAYSLDTYDIALDLGGWRALADLRSRLSQRGIRLSADMVPNHMGIDSRWVIEHPDWFLSLDQPPYPAYSYHSENLADDPRVGIFLEDHYYDHTDAAVVFQRRDFQTGDARYIYHGNDGTSFPWNDTAQLDYSRADVREAVIQTILHVARNFPIIRFDAAMTLTRKHIQRLWFPEPGTGGAIPSRAEHGMTRAEFDAAMPHEFWREVVDRVAAEVPETLLLAEAFWLLEGYFVRTLGMHRVYNSAFMHMLRDEDNARYRQLIKNTLEFDPQILKRYVNFMNNPDEKTAIEQFGSGDKYFGVCTLLATLPGLPMFGHGQVEGLREKYGMEFRKPRWDESPDEALVRGHEWKIFPLLHRRALFANVDRFFLFDFYGSDGKVNEDVIAYSNALGDERALIICHNRYASTRGWLRISAAALDKSSGRMEQRTLAEALALPRTGYAIFRDCVSHLEYIRSCRELWERGLFAELGAYQHHAFLDWRFVDGAEWEALCAALNGVGVESIEARRLDLTAARMPVVPPAPAPAKAVRKSARKTVASKQAAPKKSAPAKPSRKTTAKKAPAQKPAKKPVARKTPVKPKAKKTPARKPGRKPAAHK